MSTFISTFTRDLAVAVVPPGNTTPGSPKPQSETKDSLRSLFLDLDSPLSSSSVEKCLSAIRRNPDSFSAATLDEEERTLQRAILGKVVVDIYTQALQTVFEEARDVEAELDWWSEVERSRLNVAMYLLQTLPSRFVNLFSIVLSTIQKRGLRLHPSLFTPSSLKQLFPSSNTLRPNILTIALFPHLHHEPYAISLSTVHFRSSLRRNVSSALGDALNWLSRVTYNAAVVVHMPLEITRGECRYKRQQLEKLRNERAQALGILTSMRGSLAQTLQRPTDEKSAEQLARFTTALYDITPDERYSAIPTMDLYESLSFFSKTALPIHKSTHRMRIKVKGLMRPSRFTLLWPRLLLTPPLVFYLARSAYASRASLQDCIQEAFQTVKGFWEGWLLEPLREVIKTVRTGGDEGVIITQQSVKADLDSLERMALALARDTLHYNPDQMAALSQQIRSGDLTPVMQIYEDDIVRPLISAVRGTLLRTLLIQVQKTKVDIDQALSGIDKLLKSQELTFAFVGVAPALAIVYAFCGYLRRLWSGGKGRGRYGGSRRRSEVWLRMRRIERLLIAIPPSGHQQQVVAIPALTSGLLLLAVAHLRAYAERHLSPGSRVREGFLEDVEDLEDETLTRADKLRVLDRMWRSWGEVLGWGRTAA